MQLSENDKALILSKKDNIKKITSEIFTLLDNSQKNTLLNDSQKNRTKILDLMTQIISNLSDLSAISNYLSSEPDIHSFRRELWDIQTMFESEGMQYVLRNSIEIFCIRANSITFHEKQSGLFSKIEIKLENLYLFTASIFKK